MFEPESKDPIFKVLLIIFALIYMVGATVFLVHFKPVMEVSAIFLCASLWMVAAIHYFVSNGWSPEAIENTGSRETTAQQDRSVANIIIGFFSTVGFLIHWYYSNNRTVLFNHYCGLYILYGNSVFMDLSFDQGYSLFLPAKTS